MFTSFLHITLVLMLSLMQCFNSFISFTMLHVSLQAVIITRYICRNNQKYIIWVKIINLYYMPKIIRILISCSMKIFSTFLTINIIFDY